jgi:hypothetical protein
MLDMAFRIETRYTPVGAHKCANLHVTDILHLVPPFLYSYCTNTANIACEGRHEWWSMVEEYICVYLVPLRQTPSPTGPASVQPSGLVPYPAHSNSLGLIKLSYCSIIVFKVFALRETWTSSMTHS